MFQRRVEYKLPIVSNLQIKLFEISIVSESVRRLSFIFVSCINLRLNVAN